MKKHKVTSATDGACTSYVPVIPQVKDHDSLESGGASDTRSAERNPDNQSKEAESILDKGLKPQK